MSDTFRFNKIYVIESLEDDERNTGEELHNDLLRWRTYQHEIIETEHVITKTKSEFQSKLFEINKDCINQGLFPMLHFEIHGHENRTGLVTASGELIEWKELYESLISINTSVGNNLFITLAVCHGAFLIELIKLDRPCPFWGFVGSFDSIEVSDMSIRYNEFYDEFLKEYDLLAAFQRLQLSNPDIPSSYGVINSELTFESIYQSYLNEEFSESKIEKRFNDSTKNVNFVNRQYKRQTERDFKKYLKKTKKDYFEKDYRTFFMLDKYPENSNRFKLEIKGI